MLRSGSCVQAPAFGLLRSACCVQRGGIAPKRSAFGSCPHQEIPHDRTEFGRIPSLVLFGQWTCTPALGHGYLSASHREHSPGHIGRFGAGQPHDERGHILGIGKIECARWDWCVRPRLRLLCHSSSGARIDRIDGHAVSCQLRRRDDGERGDAGLRCPVVRLTHIAVHAGRRRCVDDPGVVALPLFVRSRQYSEAQRTIANVPRRCTLITASHSSIDIFTNIRSRKIPALLTTMSRPPKVSMARCTNRPAPAHSDTSSPLATACPPSDRMRSTTSPAGPSDLRSPSTSTPRSFTTTLAPWRANSKA